MFACFMASFFLLHSLLPLIVVHVIACYSATLCVQYSSGDGNLSECPIYLSMQSVFSI